MAFSVLDAVAVAASAMRRLALVVPEAARRVAVLVFRARRAASVRGRRRGILGESRVGALRRLPALLRVDAASFVALHFARVQPVDRDTLAARVVVAGGP